MLVNHCPISLQYQGGQILNPEHILEQHRLSVGSPPHIQTSQIDSLGILLFLLSKYRVLTQTVAHISSLKLIVNGFDQYIKVTFFQMNFKRLLKFFCISCFEWYLCSLKRWSAPATLEFHFLFLQEGNLRWNDLLTCNEFFSLYH